ncbi:MAG: hypothetical protein QXT45_06280 [Candidatus Bilamarchaeaceae archaeon]
MRVLKGNGHNLEIPNDDVILTFQVTRSGRVSISTLLTSPNDVCKIILNVAVDLMFGSLMQEDSPIVKPIITQ